jgi:peptidoglycan-associated lipoprotein
MRIRSLALALVVAVAACGKKKPDTVPTPSPGPTSDSPTTPSNPSPGNPNAGRPTTDPNASVRADLMRTLQEPIYFEYDQDAIRPDAQTVLERKAAILLANPGLRIRVAGHTDDRGSDEYNLVLGTKRATAAKRFFESKGIDGSRIDIISFGEERPVDPAQNEGAWAKNRRDEFEVTAGGDRLVRPQ